MATDYSQILKTGKENATPAADLAQMLGFSNTRALQADIAKSRQEGQVIISSTSGGYYLPANLEEVAAFVRSLEARAKHTFLAIRSARQALEDLPGQMDLMGMMEGEAGTQAEERRETD